MAEADDHPALSSSSMISISGIDFEIRGREIEYQLQVHAGAVQAWVVTKVYEDFEDLHEELQKNYPSYKAVNRLPYLTGRVAPWNVGTRETGARRLRRFEEYLSQLVVESLNYDPPDLVVQLPHPDDPSVRVIVNKFVFEFLEFIQNFKIQAPPTQPPPSGAEGVGLEEGKIGPGSAIGASTTAGGLTASAGGEDGLSVADSQSSNHTQSIHNKSENILSSGGNGGQNSEKDLSAAQVDSAHISSQIQACVIAFNVFPGSHIAYTLECQLCTVCWTLDKRFTDFVNLRTELAQLYGETRVPSLDEAFVPPSDRLQESTAVIRQQEMTKLLQLTLPDIDNWTPQGFVAELKMPYLVTPQKKGEFLRVFINKLMFDFLEIDRHSARMKAESAEEDIERKKLMLNEKQKAILEQERQRKIRKAITTKFYERRKAMRSLSESRLTELCDLIASLDDDRDTLAVMTHFCRTGEIAHDLIHEIPGVFSATNSGGGGGGGVSSSPTPSFSLSGPGGLHYSPSSNPPPLSRDTTDVFTNNYSRAGREDSGILSRSHSTMYSGGAGGGGGTFEDSPGASSINPGLGIAGHSESPVGLTSLQLTKLAVNIAFCDTRTDVILMVVETVLLDDDTMDAVVDTVEFNWEELSEEIERSLVSGSPEARVLLKKKAR